MSVIKPKCLYKFRSINLDHKVGIERFKQIVIENKLYFAAPSEINDPFDCKIPPNFDADEKTLRQFIIDETRNNPDFPGAPDSVIESFADDVIASDGVKKLSKDMLASMRLAQGQILNRNVGVCCFSAVKNDILLWAHYANGHTGICLEFNIQKGIQLFHRAKPVKYYKSYPNVNFFKCYHKNEHWMPKILIAKANCWKYESEWRVFKFDGPGLEIFPECCLTAIIFGCQMQDREKHFLINFVKENKMGIKLIEARMKENKYGLKFMQIT
ncbi:DUF2971 domain-containing protein [candidate division KSB1 bacterium]|nr:DUF2971 domain-containing protein [candidate division KSB1 bacterium]